MKKYKYLRYLIIISTVYLLLFLFQPDKIQEDQIHYNTDPDVFLSKDMCVMSCKKEPHQSQNVFNTLHENMTLVTSYFDIGTYRKGNALTYNKKKFLHWASAYRFVVNSIIIYTDSDEFVKFMTKVRIHFPEKTKIIKIDRQSLWPFQMTDRIRSVFSQFWYPKHHPNTVIPEYSATQHAKYALVSDAIRNKYFENEFYAWIDIGYFRNSVNQYNYFQLRPPPDFDKQTLAVNKVRSFTKGLTPSVIFRKNKIWVGGGMFIGTPDLLLQFEQLYKRAIIHFLDKRLMNTDQQLLYSLYSEEGRRDLKPQIELQLYSPADKYEDDPWFYLGYHCRHMLPNNICPPCRHMLPNNICPPNSTSKVCPTQLKDVK